MQECRKKKFVMFVVLRKKRKKGEKVKGELRTEQLKPMQITPSDCVIVLKGFSVKSWLTL